MKGDVPDDSATVSSVLAKIESDHYAVGPLAEKPPKLPALMRKSMAEMDEEEVAQVLEVNKKYREEQALYQMAVDDRERAIADKVETLRMDLQDEFDIPDGPQAQAMFDRCKQYADGDLVQLFGYYDDWAGIVFYREDNAETKSEESLNGE